MITLLAASLLATQPACAAPEGTAALLDGPQRFIVLGEDHGTTEIPAAYAQMVCAASERGPVVVALEFPDQMQPALDAFLAAPDDVAAVQVLHDTFFWNLRIQDGRFSAAMLEMMQSVRDLKAAGRQVSFRAFRVGHPRVTGMDQNYSEIDMAQGLVDAARSNPDARVMVLVGDFHAMKIRMPGDDLTPALAHLPAKDVIALEVAQQGGSSWSCVGDGCGPRDIYASYPHPEERGITLEPDDRGLYDGRVALGPLTPSPPAAEGDPAARSD